MLKFGLTLLLLVWCTASHATSLRQFHSETSTPLDEIVRALETQMPGQVRQPTAGRATLAYAGNTLPPRLAGFLAAAFENLPSEVLVPGTAVSLSLMLSSQGAGTDMSLMIMAAFPHTGVPLVPDSVMVMDGSGPGACTGQMVVQHLKPKRQSARIWRNHLESEGFSFADFDPESVSFFIGHRPGCEIALYLHPDQNTTMVVIRYLEE